MSHAPRIRDLYDAFAKGDVPTVLGAMAEDIEWREAEGNPYSLADGAAFVGPQAVLDNVFMRLATEFDGFTVSPREFHDAGDTVLVEVRYSGVANATGQPIDVQARHVWRLGGDGRIASFQQYADTAQLQDALGVRQSSSA